MCDVCVLSWQEKADTTVNSEMADTTVSESAENEGDDNNGEKVDDTVVCVC